MNINEAHKMNYTKNPHQKATLVTLESDSSSTTSTSSQINFEINISNSNINNEDEMEDTNPNGGDVFEENSSNQDGLSNTKPMGRDSILRRNIKGLQSRRLSNSSSYPNSEYGGCDIDTASTTNGSIFGYDEPSQKFSSNSKKCCAECGSYTFVIRCASHCDRLVCEGCQEKHWQMEINELLNMKTFMENSVADLRKYLSVKRSQCLENVKSSSQIKKFITMTMHQIKRKVELELENKRDELFSAVDSFCENQKKFVN